MSAVAPGGRSNQEIKAAGPSLGRSGGSAVNSAVCPRAVAGGRRLECGRSRCSRFGLVCVVALLTLESLYPLQPLRSRDRACSLAPVSPLPRALFSVSVCGGPSG